MRHQISFYKDQLQIIFDGMKFCLKSKGDLSKVAKNSLFLLYAAGKEKYGEAITHPWDFDIDDETKEMIRESIRNAGNENILK